MHRTAGRTGKNRAAGLTVLELLITLTVAWKLTSIAIPSYQRINAQNRLATSTNQIMMAMVSQRQAAVTRTAAVTLFAGNPDAGCDRKRVVWGKRVAVRVDIGGHRNIKKKKTKH